MKRRAFLTGIPSALAGPAFLASISQASSGGAPLALSHTSGMNVLFINIDDMATNAVACYGNSAVKTPQLDRFAATAMRFARCYCQTPQGYLSRASVLTGLRPDSTGVAKDTDPAGRDLGGEIPTVADLLCRYGIHTVDSGSFLGGLDAGNAEGNSAAQIISRLARPGRQFFLSVGFTRPQSQPWCPSEYLDLYDGSEIPLPSARGAEDVGVPALAKRSGPSREFAGCAEGGPAGDEEARHAIRAYYGFASYIDAQVGNVLEALGRTGLENNTIVIIFGSHGLQLGEHSLWGASTLFEQSTRVPLLIRVPGLTIKGAVCDEIVELVDLLPTLCKLLVIPPPDGLEGASLTPLLVDPQQPWKLAAFSVFSADGRVGRSVRTKRWRYTEWQSRETASREFELYDLNSDPWEQHNLARDESCRNQRTILANLLQRGWRVAHPHPQQDRGRPGGRPSYRAHVLW